MKGYLILRFARMLPINIFMQLELLDYQYLTNWNLNELTTKFKAQHDINPSWPLVCTTLSSFSSEANQNVWADFTNGRKRGRPREIRGSTIDSAFTYVAEQLGLTGFVQNVQGACAGSLYAFYNAALISQSTQLPVIVWCGDNYIHPYGSWHFNSFGALDQETGLPFDSTSKGFKLGDAAALYLVKHPSVKHTADVRAVIQNFHFYTNPELVTNPGSADDIIRNLSNIDFKRVELWNAHATGTPVGDPVEYEFFSKTIKQDIPIIGYKGYVGHTLSACGAIEIALALDDKARNELRPNLLNGPAIAVDDRIITSPTAFTYTHMLKTSMGFGGKTAVVEIDLY